MRPRPPCAAWPCRSCSAPVDHTRREGSSCSVPDVRGPTQTARTALSTFRVTATLPARLDFVNGGGTGSLDVTGRDPSLTQLAAGSGLYAPTLFDGYDSLHLEPAAFFATPVVRRSAEGLVTAYGGGYVASGPPGWSRVATSVDDQRLALIKTEGTGEVQTPRRGRAAGQRSLGDRVWFRHAKAGELAERLTDFTLLSGDEVVGTAATYRGEGQCFT